MDSKARQPGHYRVFTNQSQLGSGRESVIGATDEERKMEDTPMRIIWKKNGKVFNVKKQEQAPVAVVNSYDPYSSIAKQTKDLNPLQ